MVRILRETSSWGQEVDAHVARKQKLMGVMGPRESHGAIHGAGDQVGDEDGN